MLALHALYPMTDKGLDRSFLPSPSFSPSRPFPATASAEGRQFNGAAFPATASAEGAQLNVPPSPTRGEGEESLYNNARHVHWITVLSPGPPSRMSNPGPPIRTSSP